MTIEDEWVGPVPPVSSVWYDLDETTSNVLAILRLTEGDVDADRIRRLVPAAGRLIDDYVDRTGVLDGPPPDPEVQAALEQVTIVLYSRKGPTGGAVAGGVPGYATAYVTSDPLAEVLAEVLGHKERWGLA